MSWEEYHLARKYAMDQRSSIYIQREILTRMINGVPVGNIEKFGKHDSKKVFPLGDEYQEMKSEREELLKAMDNDPAFGENIVLVPGQGYMTKEEAEKWLQRQN